jgi:hypothetical protein
VLESDTAERSSGRVRFRRVAQRQNQIPLSGPVAESDSAVWLVGGVTVDSVLWPGGKVSQLPPSGPVVESDYAVWLSVGVRFSHLARRRSQILPSGSMAHSDSAMCPVEGSDSDIWLSQDPPCGMTTRSQIQQVTELNSTVCLWWRGQITTCGGA